MTNIDDPSKHTHLVRLNWALLQKNPDKLQEIIKHEEVIRNSQERLNKMNDDNEAGAYENIKDNSPEARAVEKAWDDEDEKIRLANEKIRALINSVGGKIGIGF